MGPHAGHGTQVLWKQDWADKSASCRLHNVNLAFLVGLQLVCRPFFSDHDCHSTASRSDKYEAEATVHSLKQKHPCAVEGQSRPEDVLLLRRGKVYPTNF